LGKVEAFLERERERPSLGGERILKRRVDERVGYYGV
jgi:hypothetical protein